MKSNNIKDISIDVYLLSGECMVMPELSYWDVRKIRKMIKDGVEVPQICKEFNIDPASWRDVSLKYSLLK
jgi:hypothetical protein